MRPGELAWLVNDQLRRLGVRFEVSEHAPDTFKRLQSECTERRLIVWPGASERTVYGAPQVNWGFRAWHDAMHLKLSAPFTPEGEREVCRVQMASCGSDALARILHAEIVGQLEYQAVHGAFPSDQIEFVQSYLKRGGK